MDRCAADAVWSVTGCSLGHKTTKFRDCGKMAVTFVNLKTGRAVSVIAKEESCSKAKECFSDIDGKYLAQFETYEVMPDEELFEVMEMEVKIEQGDMSTQV